MTDPNIDWADVDAGLEPDDVEWADPDAAHQLDQYADYPVDLVSEDNPQGFARIRLQAAADMKPRRIKWLAGTPTGGTIPIGGLTLLAGREGIGKSTITYDLISQITRGAMPGEYQGKPKSVVVYATEDEWEPVIVPRLMAAKADLTRVHRADAYNVNGEKEAITFPLDLKKLGEQCVKNDVVMVVIDPIMSVINGKLDTHKDRDVRQMLDPLTAFASAAGIAVLGLIHVNKSGGNDPLNSVMGSRAFSAVARSVLFCVKIEPDDQDAQPTYLFTHEKCNLGPKQASKQYEIKTFALAQHNKEDGKFEITTSKVEWGFYDKRTARDVLDRNDRTVRPDSVKAKILRLLDVKGVTSKADLLNELVRDGVNAGTIPVLLSRMSKTGEILNAPRGFYAPVTVDHILNEDGSDDETSAEVSAES